MLVLAIVHHDLKLNVSSVGCGIRFSSESRMAVLRN